MELRQYMTLEEPYGSIFEKAESLSIMDSYQTAIRNIAGDEHMEKYRSIVDFIFCELFTNWKPKCKMYYKGHGKKLKYEKIVTKEWITAHDQKLVLAFELALGKYNNNTKISWAKFHDEWRKVVKEEVEQLIRDILKSHPIGGQTI